MKKPVDWAGVARARRRLDEIKDAHPELVGPVDTEQWVDILAKGEVMAETQQTAFRLPIDLLNRLDKYAKRLEQASPGLTVTRADVVRMLLSRGLDQVEDPRGKQPRKK